MRNVPVPPAGDAVGARSAQAAPEPVARVSGGAPERESIGDLIGNVTRDLSTLMRQEVSLARAELKQEAVRSGQAAGAYGGAGMAALLALLFLSLAVWAGLSTLMHPGWAALTVAVTWAVIAALLYFAGRARFRRLDPRPTRTIDTLGHVPDALKGHRGGTP
jgi:hypothetical protein